MLVRIKASALEYYDKGKWGPDSRSILRHANVDKVIYEKEENIEIIGGGEFMNKDSSTNEFFDSTTWPVDYFTSRNTID